MTNVVVTGGAGFIGRYLVNQLIREGIKVTVLDNLSTGKREDVCGEAHFIKGDIRDTHIINTAFNNKDYVFHLAALPRIQKSIDNPSETNEVNIQGTLNVLEGARQHNIKRVIYTSSSSVYGDQDTYPLTEDLAPRPLSPYALQKYVGEQYAHLYYSLYGLETVCLRYFSVYGPGQSGNDQYATVISKFLHLKRLHKPLMVYGDGKAVRDFTYVDDVVAATIQAMKLGTVCRGDVYNICTSQGHSVNEVARAIGGHREYKEKKKGESRRIVGSNAKAYAKLSWKPLISLTDGLSRINRQ